MIGVIRLQREELASCWAALGLPDPPYLLRLTGPGGASVQDRERRIDRLLAGLAHRGLADGVRPVPALAEALHRVAAADYRLDIRFPGADRPAVLGLGAVAGRHAVALIGAEGTGPVRLLTPTPGQLADLLLRTAGELNPGVGCPVNIPAELLDRALLATGDGGIWALSDRLRAVGVGRAEATSLARMCDGVTFGGRLGASASAVNAAEATERRGGWVVGFHRTGAGHFMHLRRHGTLTVAPTDRPRLLRHWRELLDSLLDADR